MKKFLFIPIAAILCALMTYCIIPKEEAKAMEGIIRLHVRAENDSPKEQNLKLKVRDGILNETSLLLADCESKQEAKQKIESNLDRLKQAGQAVVNQEGSNHTVSVSLGREQFDYREYDGFFLPAGEYDSLIVDIGSGNGKNWWCVIFPAACYMGAAEVETNPSTMPECFRLAKSKPQRVTVKFWLWEQIKGIFD